MLAQNIKMLRTATVLLVFFFLSIYMFFDTENMLIMGFKRCKDYFDDTSSLLRGAPGETGHR